MPNQFITLPVAATHETEYKYVTFNLADVKRFITKSDNRTYVVVSELDTTAENGTVDLNVAFVAFVSHKRICEAIAEGLNYAYLKAGENKDD